MPDDQVSQESVPEHAEDVLQREQEPPDDELTAAEAAEQADPNVTAADHGA
jgi:hypothetical protein